MSSLVSSEVHELTLSQTNDTLVGRWSYESKVSGQQEFLPVAASLMGSAGADYELVTFACRFLKECKLPDAVKTGRDIFEGDPKKRETRFDPPRYGLYQPKPMVAEAL